MNPGLATSARSSVWQALDQDLAYLHGGQFARLLRLECVIHIPHDLQRQCAGIIALALAAGAGDSDGGKRKFGQFPLLLGFFQRLGNEAFELRLNHHNEKISVRKDQRKNPPERGRAKR